MNNKIVFYIKVNTFMSRTKKSYFYCWLNSVTKVVCIFFLLLIYCFLGLYVNWGVEYLSLFLKIGSSIKQRFHNLKATISLPSLPTKSTWQGFGWECNCTPHNHLATLGSNQVASFMISVLCNEPIQYSSANTHT